MVLFLFAVFLLESILLESQMVYNVPEHNEIKELDSFQFFQRETWN